MSTRQWPVPSIPTTGWEEGTGLHRICHTVHARGGQPHFKSELCGVSHAGQPEMQTCAFLAMFVSEIWGLAPR